MEGAVKTSTPDAWLQAVLGPDHDPHAEERAARVAKAKADAERVRRGPAPLVAAAAVAPTAPLRFCSTCSTARHTLDAGCPCGGSWL